MVIARGLRRVAIESDSLLAVRLIREGVPLYTRSLALLGTSSGESKALVSARLCMCSRKLTGWQTVWPSLGYR